VRVQLARSTIEWLERSSSTALKICIPRCRRLHPEADELLFLVSGAVDVILQEGDAERTVALGAGQAAIVPRGVWHRLVMREPGKLLFINSRTGMESRHAQSLAG
jgi:mannose-6-phosphate isomerase-like protein (cupin superfamily)